MAQLRDLRPLFRNVGLWPFVVKVFREIIDDSIFMWAAALAYAWLFAIFPFFIFLLTLVPYVPAHITARAEEPLYDALDRFLPTSTARILHDNINNVIHQTHTGLLSIGILVTIWAASGGMNMTMSAFEKIYDVPKPRPFYKQRPMAILLTLIVAAAVILVLMLLPIGSIAIHYLQKHEVLMLSESAIFIWNFARWFLALVLMFGVLAIMYRFGPSVKQHFTTWSPGAIFTVAAWLLLGLLFRVYVQHFGRYDKMYGTVGGVVILLLFFYIDAVVLLVGAEINAEIDFAMGVRRGSTDFRRPPQYNGCPEDQPL